MVTKEQVLFAVPSRVAKCTDASCANGWCRLTVNDAVLVVPAKAGSLTEILLTETVGGPSSLTIVPIAAQDSLVQNAPPATLERETKICSSGSMTASPQMVMLTLRVPFGVLGGMLNGTLVNCSKSTPAGP